MTRAEAVRTIAAALGEGGPVPAAELAEAMAFASGLGKAELPFRPTTWDLARWAEREERKGEKDVRRT